MTYRFPRWIAAAVMTVALGTSASAQQVMHHANDPYFERTLELSQAFGLEMLGVRLTVAEVYQAPITKDLAVQLNKMATKDLGRFYGTLQQKNPTLANELKGAVDGVVKAINDGQPAAAAVARARPLLALAYKVVIDPTLQNNLQFKAATTANLLVNEDGVAEAFEEAAKPTGPWQYPMGWAAFARVKTLWEEMAPRASAERRSEAALLFEFTAHFYKTHTPPKPFPNEDAEEVEALSHQMVTVIEDVADSYLYTGRDMPRLAEHLGKTLGPACADYAAGKEALATERTYAVLDLFVSEAAGLSGAISVMAPEVEQNAIALFPRLVVTRYAAPAGGVNRTMPAADACTGLVTMLADARKVVAR
jgi:hypothetical protein